MHVTAPIFIVYPMFPSRELYTTCMQRSAYACCLCSFLLFKPLPTVRLDGGWRMLEASVSNVRQTSIVARGGVLQSPVGAHQLTLHARAKLVPLELLLPLEAPLCLIANVPAGST